MNKELGARAIVLMFAALILAETTAAIELTMTYSALPTILKAFPGNASVPWLITSHFLVYAAGAALCGRLGDLYGLKRVLLWVLSIALCGSLLSVFSDGLGWLIVGRGMQGLAGAVVPLAYGVVRRSLPQARIPLAVSVIAMAATVVGSMGLLIGGVVIDNFPWRAIFYVSSATAALALLACALWVPHIPARSGNNRLDLVGGILFVPGITALLYAIMQAKGAGWSNPVTLSFFFGGLLVLAGWLAYELRHPDPMIDLRLMRRRQICLGDAAMALLCLGALQYSQVLPILLQQPSASGQGFGLSATTTGLLQLPIMVLYLAGGPWSGYLTTRYSARTAALVGGMLVSVGWVAIAIDHSNLVFLMGMDYVQALGMAVLFSAIPNLIVEDTPAERVSEATGMLSVIRSVSLAVGSQVYGFALATSTIADPAGGLAKFPSPAAYTLAFSLIAGVCLLLLSVAFWLPRRSAKQQEGQAVAAARPAVG